MHLFSKITICFSGSFSTSMRANFRSVYTIPLVTDNNYDDGIPEELLVHEIQADQYKRDNVLAAIGNAIYTVDGNYKKKLIAGFPDAGYAEGNGPEARFNRTAGFTQLPGGRVLISDQGNQCIRQLHRMTTIITTYAGICSSTPRYYQGSNYSNWQTFNKPTQIQFDSSSSKIFVLDEIVYGETFAILSKDLYTGNISEHRISTRGDQITDFIYDHSSSAFVIAGLNGVTKRTLSYEVLSTINVSDPYGLALYDGMIIITRINSGEVMFVDERQDGSNFTICGSSSHLDGFPKCTLSKPAAVAVIDSFLCIGSTIPSFYDTKAQLIQIFFWTDPG